MNTLEGIILGLVQGVTEFLPVSSSGHLALMRALLGEDSAFKGSPLLFDVTVHAATLLAIVIYFRVEVLKLIRGLLVTVLSVWARFRPKPGSPAAADRKLFILVLVASVPTAVIALLLRPFVAGRLQEPIPVGVMLIVTGSILFMTRSSREPGRPFRDMNPIDAGVVGFIQGLAVLPGISRSGSTIAMGVILGLERKLTARFSFLIAVPAMVGAAVLELPKLAGESAAPILIPALAGAVVAFISGYAALAVLVRVLEKGKFAYFAPYCWLVGLLGVVLGIVSRL